MSRFQRELSGSLGFYWQQEAMKELAKVKRNLENGQITIDEKGVARNSIGRVLMDDMMEKVAMVSDRIDLKATAAARAAEVEQQIAEYRKNQKPLSAEDLGEMRSAFGSGTVLVDVLTGNSFKL